MNKNMKGIVKTILWLVIIVVVIWVVWYVLTREPIPEEEVIKIGATLPLTGDISTYGIDAKNAIDLVVKEINEVDIDGKKIEIIYEDDQCDPKQVVTTVNKLINVDKVKIILGPFCSGAALAAVPITQSNNVFLLSGSVTNPGLADYNLFFRTIPSDDYQGKFAAEYTYNILGKRKVAISYAQNDYCIGLKDIFTNEEIKKLIIIPDIKMFFFIFFLLEKVFIFIIIFT